MKCKSCGTPCVSVSTDETGTLGKCNCGDWTFDASRTSSTGINISGGINVTGTCAIGHGAVAIGNTGSRKDKKKGRR
ncbi:hypothetical protein [Micromonospora haikouensis]|uniref:Uncharacterized protein n=1 Tax=Micromonospora haikouensis TaxID=686309 RepID=A0A0D0X064_9ACTN|nr:hypothetical protein [Micromonospora haikouensis]KIR64264.1 hypothetical protein TK50_00645 [Micromonospora haikouensis]